MGMKIHLIAIGGAAMHNMAIALSGKGYEVSGSDDEINEPSKSRLLDKGLLPEKTGWFPEKIHSALDAVILGMHARKDNPELLKAQELGLRIYSYPEYLYEQTKNKIRVVIGGSHGKTTITAMVLHVLKSQGIKTDYMVGAQIEGFDTMVSLSHEAEVAIFEGDEYLASPIDLRPKFHLYKPHIALLSGIAWDHVNVFPTFEIYLKQFEEFIYLIENNGKLIFCEEDTVLNKLSQGTNSKISKIPYSVPAHEITNGVTNLRIGDAKIPLKIFGDHNLMNLEGARNICNALGVSNDAFYSEIRTFKGAAKRLEPVGVFPNFAFYKDFAHSPSKLKATVHALKKQYPERKLVACLELHTFSSLSENFLNEYSNCMDECDVAIVYFNPHTIAHKKLNPISSEQVKRAFNRNDLIVFSEQKTVIDFLCHNEWKNRNLLMMSSGTFDGLNFSELLDKIQP